MQTITSPTIQPEGVVVQSAIKAGPLTMNHSEGVVVQSAVKAGAISFNHSETLVQTNGIAVKTQIRAGGFSTSPG